MPPNSWKTLFSHKTDNWSTPKDLLKKLDEEFNFTYDPCPLQSEDITVLLQEWKGRVFCNPPYSNIRPFLEKALIELKKGNIEIAVFLLFARTDTKWFHDLVYGKHEVRFLKGRLKFGNAKNSAPAPSMLVILKPK